MYRLRLLGVSFQPVFVLMYSVILAKFFPNLSSEEVSGAASGVNSSNFTAALTLYLQLPGADIQDPLIQAYITLNDTIGLASSLQDKVGRNSTAFLQDKVGRNSTAQVRQDAAKYLSEQCGRIEQLITQDPIASHIAQVRADLEAINPQAWDFLDNDAKRRALIIARANTPPS
jgi:hypothetical protein